MSSANIILAVCGFFSCVAITAFYLMPVIDPDVRVYILSGTMFIEAFAVAALLEFVKDEA